MNHELSRKVSELTKLIESFRTEGGVRITITEIKQESLFLDPTNPNSLTIDSTKITLIVTE